MGLDIYLYKYTEDPEKVWTLEKEYEEKSEEIWQNEIKKLGKKEYKELTQRESDFIYKMTQELNKKMGLGENGAYDKGKIKIEINSTLYPEHLFKIGYLRSSYNSGGINSIVRNATGKDLYYIFNVSSLDSYHIIPDWDTSLKRAKEVLAEFKSIERFHVEEIYNHHDENIPNNAEEVLALFMEERKEWKENKNKSPIPFHSYINNKGSFYQEGSQIYAIINGLSYNKKLTHYAVFKLNDENGKFYIQALEIIIEMCEYVLAQDNPKQYILHWSG